MSRSLPGPCPPARPARGAPVAGQAQLAPPTVGFLADWQGLPIAMTVIAPMVALAAVLTWIAPDNGELRCRPGEGGG